MDILIKRHIVDKPAVRCHQSAYLFLTNQSPRKLYKTNKYLPTYLPLNSNFPNSIKRFTSLPIIIEIIDRIQQIKQVNLPSFFGDP